MLRSVFAAPLRPRSLLRCRKRQVSFTALEAESGEAGPFRSQASSSCGTSQKPVRGRMTKLKQSGAFSGHRFPPEIIGYAVWAYHRFPMSLRDAEDLLAARGVVVSYETIRAWVAQFGLQYAKAIRRDRPEAADKWHLDEVVLPINSEATAPP